MVFIPVGMESGEPVVSVALDAPPPDAGHLQSKIPRPASRRLRRLAGQGKGGE
ncbi:MAG: hypothetical protein HY774_10745 [Acidobacteria bacterium]|nr:hypothetical protein [Acidobacteriota bacterium]